MYYNQELGLCIEFGPVRVDSVRRGGAPPRIKSPLRRFTPSWTSTRVTCDCLLPFVHPLLSQVFGASLQLLCISRFTECLADPADRLCISRFTEYLADRLCISRFTEYLADLADTERRFKQLLKMQVRLHGWPPASFSFSASLSLPLCS